MTILQFPERSPRRSESTGPGRVSPPPGAVGSGPVQSFNTSPGLFLVSQGDQPRAPHGSSGAAATHGAGPVSSPGPAPHLLSEDDEPSMSTLRRALAKALLDGDSDRAEMFRGVIALRVERAQALPSSPIPDDAA
jgi:hypothetical protein